MSVLLRLCTHPFLCINTFTESHLQVSHEFLHLRFRRSGEEAVAVHFTESFTHCTLHGIGGTFPERMILGAARDGLAEEIEVCFTYLVSEQTRGTINYIPFHIGTQVFCGQGTV